MDDSLKGVGGVRLRGEVGEVWVHGVQAGLLYRWVVVGWEADFRLEAERYRLYPDLFQNGDREVSVRLDMKVGSIKVHGQIWTDFVADDKSHRAMVIRGRRMLWNKERAASAI